MERIAEVVLLGGAVRQPPLARDVGRSLLDLPVTVEQSLLEIWQCEVDGLAKSLGRADLPLRLLLDRRAPEPRPRACLDPASFQVSRDPVEYRGTAGVLRDASVDRAPDAFLLVASAAQLPLEPLQDVCRRMAEAAGDATIVSHDDGTPGGLMLIRCGCLHGLAPAGYIDMKEQALPRIAEANDVRVLRLPRPAGLPLRTRWDYLSALRSYHRSLSGDSLAEHWSPSFAVVEESQGREPGSTIHDSVVLRGGRVEAGAVVVRSIVCPAGVVPAGTTVVDGLVTAPC